MKKLLFPFLLGLFVLLVLGATGMFPSAWRPGSNVTFTTNGSIVTIAASVTGGSGTPGGTSGAVQFHQSAIFAGTNRFVFNRTNEILSVPNVHINTNLIVTNRITTALLQVSTDLYDGAILSATNSDGTVHFRPSPGKVVTATLTSGSYTNGAGSQTILIPNGSARTNWLYASPANANAGSNALVTIIDFGKTASGTNIWVKTPTGTINGGPTETNICCADGASVTLRCLGASGWWIISAFP